MDKYTIEYKSPSGKYANNDVPFRVARRIALNNQEQIAVAFGDWAIGWFDSRGRWHDNPQYQARTLCVNCGSHIENPADPDPICGCCGRLWATVDEFLPVR